MGFCVSKETLAMFERRKGQLPSYQLFQADLTRVDASVSSLHQSLQAVLVALQTQNKLLGGVIVALVAETAISAVPLSSLATPLLPLYALVETSGGGLSFLESYGAVATSPPSGSPLP